MSTRINISEIFRTSFGTQPDRVPQLEPAVAKKVNGQLGGKFYAEDVNGIEHFMPVELDGYIMPFATLDITTKQIIVSTPMTELRGAVHEIVGQEDCSISLRGLLIQEQYPESEVIEWNKVFEKGKSIIMKCLRTDPFLKKDDRVLIQEVRWPASNSEHVQPIEMKLITDRVFTLEI